MKANEAPEKIYLNWVNYPLEEMQVEYTRTDAFIEKAVNFFEEYLVEEDCKFGHAEWIELKSKFESIDDFIRAFKYHINKK